MKTITKNDLKKMVKNLMLEPTDEVLDGILDEWNEINKHLKNLNILNEDEYFIKATNNVPLTHLARNDFDESLLRNDIVDQNYGISKSQILTNAAESDEDYILIEKVVK